MFARLAQAAPLRLSLPKNSNHEIKRAPVALHDTAEAQRSRTSKCGGALCPTLQDSQAQPLIAREGCIPSKPQMPPADGSICEHCPSPL
eukprot:scaffold121408_cov30-Tisochrysis_lutea.AAC.12